MARDKAVQAARARKARAENRQYYKNQRLMINALARAKTKLAERYPEELLILYNEERASVGLPPVNTSKIGRPPKQSSHKKQCI